MKFQAAGFFLLLLTLLIPGALPAQVIFSEDFENGIPSGFTVIDADSNIVNPNVSAVNEAWIAYQDFRDTGNVIALSTSWYSPIDTSDDWLITPRIHLDSFAVLEWDAEAYLPVPDADGYEVRVAATSSITDFLSGQPLFFMENELTERTRRRIDLAALGYVNRDVYIAFRNNSFDDYLLLLDNIELRNRPSVEAALLSWYVPSTSCMLSGAEDITVVIENFGTTAFSNFNVSYVMGDGIIFDTITETVTATILPDDTLSYTFNQKADLSVPGTFYTLSAFITVAGDYFSNNNSTAVKTVVNVATHDATNEYYTGFENFDEQLGWTVEDNNHDGFTWFVSGSQPHLGSLSFRYNWNADLPADDWLFSTCFDLTGGKLYMLTFYYKVGISGATVYDEKLRVMLGAGPAASSMTDTLKDLGTLSNPSYQQDTIYFTALSTGTYYIGFNVYSDKDQFYLVLDDITVGELKAPVASFTTGKNGLKVNFASTSTDADSLRWDFGDGSSGTGSAVSHTYAAAGNYYVCLTAFNQVGSDTFCDSVTVDTLQTGMEVLNEPMFKIYPNPSSGIIVVESGGIPSEIVISIHDLLGRERLKHVISGERNVFDISGISEGIYLLSAKSAGIEFRKRMVVIR